ncbi:MAG: PaaI family thioesterase [Chloroflexaceae bacterium]|jgi:uncharacterized protein (TIGR00369 family)|nr:PaaI family thioesterase [Chloroflexaceae bacterium]
MAQFQVTDPQFAERVHESFNRQTIMHTIGASLTLVEPGVIEITLPFRADLCQQHGFLHAGVITTVVDSACGYAAFTLMPTDAAVMSVEFKVNLLSPATGEQFLARGTVLKPGRTITVTNGELWAQQGDSRKLVATMTATMIRVEGRNIAG